MIRTNRLLLGLVALLAITLGAGSAQATTFVQITLDERIADADAVVIATCEAIESRVYRHASGEEVVTFITLDVESALAGAVPTGRLVLRQIGGEAGATAAWISGSPRYVVGERALLFLASDGTGAYTTSGLCQGHWPLAEVDGAIWAIQDAGDEGVLVLPAARDYGGRRVSDRYPLAEIRAAVERQARAPKRELVHVPNVPAEFTERQFATKSGHTTFTIQYQQRWFEPDDGGAIAIALNPAGWDSAHPDLAAAERDALAAWSSVAGSALEATFSGVDASGCGWRQDGVSRVSIDCGNQIAGTGCRSILAIGGANKTSAETRTVNGTSYRRILEGDVVLADGYCDLFANPAYLRYVLTHELGHCLGFGHSSDNTATMFAAFRSANATRGAALGEDDQAAARFLYPTGLALASTALEDASVERPYHARLEVSGGTEPFVFAVESGSFPPGLGMDPDGTIDGTPAAPGDFAFTVTISDAASRTARGSVTVRVTAGSLAIPAQSFPPPRVGVPFEVRLTAAGGVAPYRWRVSAGDLPRGLQLSSDGVLDGVPVERGRADFTVTVTDAANGSVSSEFWFDPGPSPIEIDRAAFDAATNQLILRSPTLAGAEVLVEINGDFPDARLRLNRARSKLRLEGSPSRLGLERGENEIVLVVDGIRSEAYVLRR